MQGIYEMERDVREGRNPGRLRVGFVKGRSRWAVAWYVIRLETDDVKDLIAELAREAMLSACRCRMAYGDEREI